MTTFAGSGQPKLANGGLLEAAFNSPEGLFLTRSGALIVADTRNHVLRMIEGGSVSTLAGSGRSGFLDGGAAGTEFNEPRGLTGDDGGNLFIADSKNARIRKIAISALPLVVSTIAGNGRTGLVDGTPLAAEFKEPSGLVYAGALYLADTRNDSLRAVWPELKTSAIYPSSGSLQPGVVEIRIFGTGFVPGRTTVTFGSQPALVTFRSSTEILITVPPIGQPGLVDVTVTTPGGSSTLEDAYSTDTDPPIIQASIAPPATSDGWHRQPVTIQFFCIDAASGIATCSAPATLSQEGAAQSVTGTATDLAGNSASATATVNIDLTLPSLTLGVFPEVTGQTSVTLSGTASDLLSGIRSVTCNGAPATISGSSFSCALELFEGTTTVRVTALDRAGNAQERVITIISDLTPPAVTFLSPAESTQLNAHEIQVEIDAADDDRLASVTINGTVAMLNGDRYRALVPLTEGLNTITAVGVDRAGNSASASRVVTFFSIPAVSILSPADLSVVATSTVTVSGRVQGSGVTVNVNGIEAGITGEIFTAAGIPLAQGRTVLSARAVDAAGHVATANIHLYRDSIQPRVEVYSPSEGQIVSQSPITVSGMVDDVAVGTINSGQAAVTVNGVAAVVANRSFTASNVALAPGLNLLTVVGTDQGGNQVSVTRRVTLDTSPAFSRIAAVSGHDQIAEIGSQLPAPLVVRLTDPSGVPVPARAVTFKVVLNDGRLGDGTTLDRSLSVLTDAHGEASTAWILGMRAGAGNQRVEATAAGFPGKAEWAATGLTGAPKLVVVDSGNGQFGVTGERLHRPLIAIVVDEGSNRIANVPVTFTVAQGGGSIEGAAARTVLTDSDGRAWVVPALGPEAGIDNNILTATVEGVAGMAAFYATGRPAGPLAETRISGMVADNSNIPIGGVSVRIEGSTLTAQTDAQGIFTIEPAPAGYVKLVVDGSTAQRPGTWPTLEFVMYTNPGQDNTIGMPIYLLPIDVARGIQINEQSGGTLTLPELPGFSLSIAPGSATFPSGTRSGTVSVTLVHSDKMPMAPGFGQQPRFIVTIQPTGVLFDPPAAITFPNVDGLRPGQVTEMYSFDHDLGQFVSIGTGSVSEDGTTLRSDPGVGIIKGGWHAAGDPTPTGTPADCGDCALCEGAACVADPLRIGRQCRSDGIPCTDDVCQGGICRHPPLQSQVRIEATYVDRDDPSRTWTSAKTLVLGDPLYGGARVGDHVRWNVTVATTKPIVAYKWRAVGANTFDGPTTAHWQVEHISWTPGFYRIDLEVSFQGGCKVIRSWGQYVGIRTRDYLLYGSILPEADDAGGVLPSTVEKYDCPDAARWIPLGGLGDGFNTASNGSFVPERQADRAYVMQRIFSTTANRFPVPSNPAIVREMLPGNIRSVGGLSGLNYFRQAAHVQFKYVVKDGRVFGTPMPVGDVFAIDGLTPLPCSDIGFGYPVGTYGDEDIGRNGKVEAYDDETGFAFVTKVRAGSQAQQGYRVLNRRELPWVFFRFRFDVHDGTNKTRLAAGASDDWDGPDEKDYSFVPTFVLYERVYASGHFEAVLQPGYPIRQDLSRFLLASPKVPGDGPFYPSTQ